MAEGTWVAGSILAKLKLDTSEFQKGAAAAAKGTGGLGKEADKAKSAFSGLWKQMAVGIGVTSLITKGIGFIKDQIADTIRVGREFEKQWANATTQMNLSAGAMDSMKKELLSLSPTLGSATDLAHGMYEVISAGIPAGEAIEFLGNAAKAAKAGFTDSFTAIDALTTVINAYGLSAEDATGVSDMMFESVKRGKQTYEDMAGALGTVVPIASQVGLGFDQVAAAMATLTRQGIDANTATVQLRQILVSVLNPSSEASKAAKALGLEFNAQALASKGLAGFLADVKEKTGGNVETMTALFGNVRALTGVMALGGAQAKAFAGDLDAIRDSAGQTELAFQKQMGTLDFWLDTAKNAFEKIKISFYEGFADPIKSGITTSKELEMQLRILQERFEDFGKQVGKTFKFVIDNAGTFWAALKGPAEWATVMAERASGISAMKQEMLAARIAAEDWAAGLTNLNISQEELARKYGMNTAEGAKWRGEMEKLNREIEGQKGNLSSLGGVIVLARNYMRDQINAIIETSATSGEAAKRIRELRDSVKAGGRAAEEGAGSLGILDEATKKYKEKLDQLLESLGISAEKEGELYDVAKILDGLLKAGTITVDKYREAHKNLVDEMFEYGKIVPTAAEATRELTSHLEYALTITPALAKQFGLVRTATLDMNSIMAQAKGQVDDVGYEYKKLNHTLPETYVWMRKMAEIMPRLGAAIMQGIAGMRGWTVPQLDWSKFTVPAKKEMTEFMRDISTVISDSMHEIARSIVALFNFKKLFGAVEIDVEFDSSAFDAMADAAQAAYDKITDAADRAFDVQELQISRAEEDEDIRYRRKYDRERRKIENSSMTEQQKDAALLALEIKYENAKLARERAREDAKYAREEAQKVKLLALETAHQIELDKIRKAEDLARQKLADDELGRQDSLWFKVKGIFATACENMATIFLTKMFEPVGNLIGKLAGKLVGEGTDTLTGALGETGKGVGSLGETIGGFISGIGAGIGGFISGLATGIATAITTLATAIASAATILAAAVVPLLVVGAVALALFVAFTLAKGLLDKLLGMGGGKTSDITYWLKLMWEVQTNTMNWFKSAGSGFGGASYEFITAHMGDWLGGIKISVDDTRTAVCGYINTTNVTLREIRERLKKMASAQKGLRLDEPGLVMTHGTPREPEWIIPESRLLRMAAATAGGGGARQINVVNSVSLEGTMITDREYMRSRLMPELIAALTSTEFRGKVQRALGVA